jgi:hypothetical protein
MGENPTAFSVRFLTALLIGGDELFLNSQSQI